MLTRWAMRYLKARGYMVLRLDPAARHCVPGLCWMNLYRYQEEGVSCDR